LFCAFCGALFWGFVTYALYDYGSGAYFAASTDAVLFGASGLVGVALSFVVLNWLLLLFFMPGNVV